LQKEKRGNKMMNNKLKRVIFGILIVINCVTIFYFSHQEADNSSKQSSRVVEIISNVIPAIKNMQEPNKTILMEQILTPIVRKTAHFSIYAILGMLTINFMLTIKNIKTIKMSIFALGFCFIYAITDEFHQTFIAGRSGELRDVLIDTSGALIGILFIIAINTIMKKLKNRKEMLENKN